MLDETPSDAIGLTPTCWNRERPTANPPSRFRQAAQEPALNYRHHFHAGNFADLLKHGLLLQILALMQAGRTRLDIFDTHAGAGRYDLTGEAARRSAEAEAGVAVLMAAPGLPPALEPLRAAVTAENAGGPGLQSYPGSPILAARRLRPGDRYTGCELRPDDHAALTAALAPFRNTRAALADGYDALQPHLAAGAAMARLILIDPPFERGNDYARAVAAIGQARRADPQAVVVVWTPLKDLETFDAFLGGVQAAGATGLVVEARLKPLDNPLRMNGCAMTVLAPASLVEALGAPAQAIAGWVVGACGGPGGRARLERLG